MKLLISRFSLKKQFSEAGQIALRNSATGNGNEPKIGKTNSVMLLLLLPLQLELSGTGDRKLWRMRRGLVFGGRGWGGPLPAILSVAWFVIRRPCSAAATAAAAAHAVTGGATFGPQRRQLDRVGRGGHAYV